MLSKYCKIQMRINTYNAFKFSVVLTAQKRCLFFLKKKKHIYKITPENIVLTSIMAHCSISCTTGTGEFRNSMASSIVCFYLKHYGSLEDNWLTE